MHKDTTHSIYRFTLIGAALAAALAGSGGAQAQDDIANGMIVGDTAGACRIIKQLLEPEKSPENSGFVVGIVDAEADRLGLTPRELFQRCSQAAALYAGFAAEPSAFDVAQYFGPAAPAAPSAKPAPTAILAGPTTSSFSDRLLGKDWKCEECKP